MSKWLVKPKLLLAALEILDLVPVRPGIPSSEFFKVWSKDGAHISLMLTSEATGIVAVKGRGKWPYKNPLYLDRRLVFPFINVSKDLKSNKPFQFSFEGKSFIIRQGKRKASFSPQAEVPGYANYKDSKLRSQFTLEKHIRQLVVCAKSCVQADQTTPHLNCVYMQCNGNDLDMYTTNTKVVFKAHTTSDIKLKTPLPFPLSLVDMLSVQGIEGIQFREKVVVIEFQHGRVWQTISAKAKDFPVKALRSYWAEAGKYPVVLSITTRAIAKVIARLGFYLTAVRRQDWVLNITGAEGSNVILLTSRVSHSTFKEKLMLPKPLKYKLDLDWPLDLVMPVFEYLQKDKGSLVVRLDKKGRSYISTDEIGLVVGRRKD